MKKFLFLITILFSFLLSFSQPNDPIEKVESSLEVQGKMFILNVPFTSLYDSVLVKGPDGQIYKVSRFDIGDTTDFSYVKYTNGIEATGYTSGVKNKTDTIKSDTSRFGFIEIPTGITYDGDKMTLPDSLDVNILVADSSYTNHAEFLNSAEGRTVAVNFAKVYDSAAPEYYTTVSTDSAKIMAALNAVDRVNFTQVYDAFNKLVVPAGKTLDFSEVTGSLENLDTLVLNGTIIISPRKQIFKDTIVITGTGYCDPVYPEMFGADGTDGANDLLPLNTMLESLGANNAIDMLTDGLYYTDSTLTFTDINLYGNNATIKNTGVLIVRTGFVLKGGGTISSGYTVSNNIGLGNNFLVCSDATFKASISIGDMLIVSSDYIWHSSRPTDSQGESVLISTISNDTVFIEDKFCDNYFTSNNVKVYRVDAATVIIKDLNIIHNYLQNSEYGFPTKDGIGIQVTNSLRLIIDNVSVLNSSSRGIEIGNCYEPSLLKINTGYTRTNGLGYGIAVGEATKNLRIDNCNLLSARHCITFGGSTYGQPFNSIISNTIGQTIRNETIFDAHVGSLNTTWINCIAIGGHSIDSTNIVEKPYSSYMGAWISGTTYHQGQVVSYGTSALTGIAIFMANFTTTANPSTSSDWVLYISGQSGFSTRGSDQHIINCEVRDCYAGIVASGLTDTVESVIVDGLLVKNCRYGILISNGTPLVNCSFDGVILDNDYYKVESYALKIDSAILVNTSFGDIEAKNARGIYIARLDGRLKIGDIKADDVAILIAGPLAGIGNCDSLKLSVGNVLVTGGNSEQAVSFSEIESFTATSITVDSCNKYAMVVTGNETIDLIDIGSINVTGTSLSNDIIFTASTAPISNFTVQSLNYKSATNVYAYRFDGTVTNAHIGTVTGDITGVYHTNRPTNELVYSDWITRTADILTFDVAESKFTQIETTGDGIFGDDIVVTGNTLTFGNGETLQNDTDGRITATADFRATGDYYVAAAKGILDAYGNTIIGSAGNVDIYIPGGTLTVDGGLIAEDYLTIGTNLASDYVLTFDNQYSDGKLTYYNVNPVGYFGFDKDIVVTGDITANNYDISPIELSYSASDKTMQATTGITNVVNQIGTELWTPLVVNNTGSQIDNGKAIYFTGGIQGDSIAEIALATNATASIANRTIGLATEDIVNGGYGFVTMYGLVRDFNTSGLTLFGPVYLGTAGDLTMTKPNFPAYKVIMGGLIYAHATDGVFQVGVSRVTQGTLVPKSYSFTSNGVGAGTYYNAGYYDASVTDITLTIGAAITQTYGTANGSYAAHAFVVCSGAGGTDLVLTVTGTSITDAGVRTALDSEIIIADADAVLVDEFYETSKKWIGQITYTLTGAAGTFTFNYGLDKYEDFGNNDFTLVGFEVVGEAGATDANFDIIIYHHSDQGWTYSAAAFDPGGTVITSLQTVHNTEYSTINNDPFAFKRVPINTVIDGSGSEGVVIKIITGQPSTVQSMDSHLGVVFN